MELVGRRQEQGSEDQRVVARLRVQEQERDPAALERHRGRQAETYNSMMMEPGAADVVLHGVGAQAATEDTTTVLLEPAPCAPAVKPGAEEPPQHAEELTGAVEVIPGTPVGHGSVGTAGAAFAPACQGGGLQGTRE